MKKINQIKSFYKNNEKKILIGTGIVVGSLTTAYFGSQAVKNVRLTDANLYGITETGEKFIRVELSNGKVNDFLWADAPVK